IKAVGRLSPGSLEFHLLQLRGNCADNIRGQLVLQIENILQGTVKTFCPEVNACCGLDELPCDAYTARSSAQTSFEDIAHTEFPSDLLHVHGATLVGEAGVTCDYKQLPKPRKRGNDLFHNAICEILLLGFPAQVLEGQHRD